MLLVFGLVTELASANCEPETTLAPAAGCTHTARKISANGLLISQTTSVYDTYGRLVSESSESGGKTVASTVWTRNALGYIVSETRREEGETTDVTVEMRNACRWSSKTVRLPNGEVMRVEAEWDAGKLVSTVTSFDGLLHGVTSIEHTAQGDGTRVSSVTRGPEGNVIDGTVNVYDSQQRLLVTEFRGSDERVLFSTSWSYVGGGPDYVMTTSTGGSIRVEHDAMGRYLRTTSESGEIVEYAWHCPD